MVVFQIPTEDNSTFKYYWKSKMTFKALILDHRNARHVRYSDPLQISWTKVHPTLSEFAIKYVLLMKKWTLSIILDLFASNM